MNDLRGERQELGEEWSNIGAVLLGQCREAGQIGEENRDLADLSAGLGFDALLDECAHDFGRDIKTESLQAAGHPLEGV